MLEIRDICFSWKETPLLTQVNGRLSAGEVVWLTGENGSGKSTLLKLVSGMIPHFLRGSHYQGDVLFEGRSLRQYAPFSFFPSLAYLPSRNLDFYFFGENFGEELQFTEILTAPFSSAAASRRKLLDAHWPAWVQLKENSLDRLPQEERLLALFAIYILQGARLFILDESYRHADEETLRIWQCLFKALCDEGCGILAAGHTPAPMASACWTLDSGRLRCD